MAKKRTMSRTEQILLVVAVVVIGGYFYLNQAHDPQVKKYKAAVAEHNKVVSELKKLRNEPVNTRTIQRSIEKLKPVVQALEWSYREKAQGRLAGKDRVEDAVMAVNALAGNNGLMVEELKPVAPENAGLFPGAEHERKLLERGCYRMQVSGNFMDLCRFFSELARQTPLASITGLRIEGQGDEGQVKAAMVVLI